MPFIVSVWYGSSKPNPADDFLLPFVNEMTELTENGLVINGHHISIKTRSFICDTPARSLLKGEYHACSSIYRIFHSFNTNSVQITFLKELYHLMHITDAKNVRLVANFSKNTKSCHTHTLIVQ